MRARKKSQPEWKEEEKATQFNTEICQHFSSFVIHTAFFLYAAKYLIYLYVHTHARMWKFVKEILFVATVVVVVSTFLKQTRDERARRVVSS
jgi:uncharacterized phage infection (PIP) family protein YhgE